MSSGKIILIFLGFILLAIVLLSSNKIATSLRTRFGRFLPTVKTTSKISPTPVTMLSPTPTLIKKPVAVTTNGKVAGSNTGEIPATGPAEVMWLILGGSALAGAALNKLSKKDH